MSSPAFDPSENAVPLLDRRKRRLVYWIVGALLAFFAAWVFALASYDLKKVASVLVSAKNVEFFSQAALTILLGVIAAVAFSIFDNHAYKTELGRIYNSAPPELVQEAIELLDKHKSALVFDYHVEYTLSESDTPGFLILRLKFSYQKLLSDRDLHFRIMRLKTPDDRQNFAQNQAAVDALYAKSELFFYIDEVDLRKTFGHEAVDRAYSFEYLKIAGTKVIPSVVPTDPGSLHAQLPTGHSLREPVPLEYCFRFAVAVPDIIFCLAEFPTKGVEVKFVRDSSIRDSVTVEAFELMSATTGNATVAEDSPGTHLVSHNGWVLPKSGAVFHWYPNA